jgi:acyl-[acyl-carrier-protein] desaturase
VPWSRGQDFDGPLGGRPWEPGRSALPERVRSALVQSLLTEDNLPSYHTALITELGHDGAWAEWVHRWAAEEDRHSTALRAYLHATRAVDPVALERARMQHMSAGYAFDHPGSALHGIAYVMLQEQATRVAYRNTGRSSADPVCEQLLSRISADENLHMIFYRDLLAAAFTRDPNRTMHTLWDVVRTFRMPGHGAPMSREAALSSAASGILDRGVLATEILRPLVRSLGVCERTDLTEDGERSREKLDRYLRRQQALADRAAERRAQRDAIAVTTPFEQDTP